MLFKLLKEGLHLESGLPLSTHRNFAARVCRRFDFRFQFAYHTCGKVQHVVTRLLNCFGGHSRLVLVATRCIFDLNPIHLAGNWTLCGSFDWTSRLVPAWNIKILEGFFNIILR